MLALALVAALVPSAAGHAATEPLAVEVHALEDEAEDAFYWTDGYDLYNAYVREAYWDDLGREGLVWRFDLYGGFGPASDVDELHVDLGAGTGDDAAHVRLTTADDETWESPQATVVFQNTTRDSPPYDGYTHFLQVFVPHEALDVDPRGTLEDPWMRSWAGDDLVDEAPGGVYLPGTGGQPEIPTESERHADAVDLTGPHGYVDVAAAAEAGDVNVTVETALESTGQHVALDVGGAPGWTVELEGAPEAVLDPGEAASFRLNVTDASPDRTLPLEVVTDLGGRETLEVAAAAPGIGAADADADAVVASGEEPVEEETPLGAAAGLAALAGAAILGRRGERG